jgi:holo-[acyl-carrier protein] synthase
MSTGHPVGIGIDIVDSDRFRVMYDQDDPDLLNRCFDQSELAACGTGPDRFDKLAVRFAAKEAVYKALGGSPAIAHTDIVVYNDTAGAPFILLKGAAQTLAEELGVSKIMISLSHSALSAAAVAIALS